MTLKHSANVVEPDDGTKPVGTNEWNDDHVVTGDFSPPSDDAATLGTTLKGWSDLYLAIGGVINWANGIGTVNVQTDANSFSADAGPFNVAYYKINGVTLATLGGAWKSVPAIMSIPLYGATAKRSFHLANNSTGPARMAVSRTRNSDPYTHGQILNGDGVFILDCFASNDNSWDGAGLISLSVDAAAGVGGGMPNPGLPTKWIISGTSPGFEGYTERLVMPSTGANYLAYSTCDPAYQATVTYLMDFQILFIPGTSITPVPAVGVGVGIKFSINQNTFSSPTQVMGTAEVVARDLTAASEDFDFIIKLVAGGAAAAEKLRVTSTGVLRLPTATNPSPTNGDLWFDGTDIKFRTGGITKTVTLT